MLQDWLAQALQLAGRHALSLAFFGALAENTIILGLIMPGGLVVALAAGGAREAGLPLPAVAALAGAGMTCGALLDYVLGRAGIHRLLRHPRSGPLGQRLVTELDRAAPLLRRHGWWLMLLAHSWSHARTSMAVAGASRLPVGRFLALEAPAAVLWGTFWSIAGYWLLADDGRLEAALRWAGWIGVVGIATLTLARRLWHRHRQRRVIAQRPPPSMSRPRACAGRGTRQAGVAPYTW